MTNSRAFLQALAAQLEAARVAQGLQTAHVAEGRLADRTVWALFHGRDHYVTTLNELADAMGCDLVIELRPRANLHSRNILG